MKYSWVVTAWCVATGCGDALRNNAADASADGDSTTSKWNVLPFVLGGPIQETAVVELQGKIYVIGGFDASLNVVRAVRVFDTSTSEWTSGPDLPRAIHHANAAVSGETIYVLGGMDGLNFAPIGDVYAWNPGQDSAWLAKATMPPGSARGAAAVGTIGDVIYVAGGLRSGAVATLSAYSTTGDTWDATLPSVPEARDHGCGGVIDGKLYAVGGRNTTLSRRVFEYTPGGAWVEKTAMPTARAGIACATHSGAIVVAGGEGNAATASRVFAEVEAFTPSANTWTALPPMKTPRHGTGAAVRDGVFYVPGGATKEGFGAVDTHEALPL